MRTKNIYLLGVLGFTVVLLYKFIARSDDFSRELNTTPIAPERVCIVLISGFQQGNSSESRSQIQREVQAEIPKGIANSYQKADAIAQLLGTVQNQAKNTGMKQLQEKLIATLSAYRVPPKNIIYSRWTETDIYNYKKQPTFAKLLAKINSIEPQYLAIIGHSYGACTTIRLSQQTIQYPNFIALFDPIFVPAKIDYQAMRVSSAPQDSSLDNYPRGKTIINWYQTMTWPKGIETIYDINKNRVETFEAKGYTHASIDNSPLLQEKVIEKIIAAIQ